MYRSNRHIFNLPCKATNGVLWAGLLLLTSGKASAVTPSFQILGTLDGPSGASTARAVSADGITIVGQSTSAGGYDGYRWTSTGGMRALGIADPSSGTGAIDVSDDGQTILARRSFVPEVIAFAGSTILTPPTGFTGSSLNANALSGDGNTVAGLATGTDTYGFNHVDAFRWSEAGGSLILDGPPAGYLSSQAYDVSTDGSMIVGYVATESAIEVPMRWTSAAGMQALPLPGGFDQGVAVCISRDRQTIVGNALRDETGDGVADDYQPVKWTLTPGGTWSADALADLPGDPLFGIPRAASADGSIIVGRSALSGNPELPAGTDDRAVFWDEAGKLHVLQDTLADLGVPTDGWTLRSATDISADGTVIVGDATDSLGHQQAFIATVPEPALLAVCTFALFAFHRRRRGRLSHAL